MKHKAAPAQQAIDIREERLLLLKRNELDFALDDEASLKGFGCAMQNLRLASLSIQFEQITALLTDLSDVVEANGVDFRRRDHLHQLGQIIEKPGESSSLAATATQSSRCLSRRTYGAYHPQLRKGKILPAWAAQSVQFFAFGG